MTAHVVMMADTRLGQPQLSHVNPGRIGASCNGW